MTEKLARIIWLSAADGGRQTLPSGPRYSSPARFDAAKDKWPQEAWSLVLDLVNRSSDSTDWLAKVRFLAENAPQELLQEGSRFELFEGKKCVAVGTIVPATLPPDGAAQSVAAQKVGR
jgi:hypothetical protein